MSPHTQRWRGVAAVVCLLGCVIPCEAQDDADTTASVLVELSGHLSIESRVFPLDGVVAEQEPVATGAVAEPTLYLEGRGRWSVTLTPFLRYDNADPRRTHADVREAYVLLFGDIGDSGGWEARLGVGQVFWGVTESHHLVDVVNQVDFVEHPDGEAKLGQPMAHVTWFGNWGALEAIAMPVHRHRTFPGRRGRLRLPTVVAHGEVEYHTSRPRWSPDLALRYGQNLGAIDLGISVFHGVSREPFLQPFETASGEPALLQHYDEIRQVGLEVQWTLASWLLKVEAIGRGDSRNLLGLEEDFTAAVVGGEYAFYSSIAAANVSLIAEWNYDSRDDLATPSRTPNVLQNDVFVGARLAFDDVQSTELTANLVADVYRSTRTLAFQFGRRITNEWSVRVEAIALVRVDHADFHYQLRHDSFIDLSLTYHF